MSRIGAMLRRLPLDPGLDVSVCAQSPSWRAANYTGRTLMSESSDQWVRIGEFLQDRRVQIDTRYANLRLFADERGVNYRLAWDAEHARRENYARATLTSLDVAYGLQPGSIRNMIAGGEPALADVPSAEGRHFDDPRLQQIWAIDGLPESVRLGMIAFAESVLGSAEEAGDDSRLAG